MTAVSDKVFRPPGGAGKPGWIFFAFFAAPLLLFVLTASGQAEETGDSRTLKYVGVASCASSNCHGGVAPRESAHVLQNEYITWFKRDRHAQAWKVLLGKESARIGMQLGIADPSHDKTCLVCHSTFVPDQASRGERFRTEDGVGCETCHGAASEWIRTHTATGTTHADNIFHGLRPIDRPAERAKLCLGCHQGDTEHPFSHDLYGAGHPRLSFELDTYSTIQPAHWLGDADYRERKGDHPPLAVWIDGQLAAAGHTLNLLKGVAEHQRVFPELSAFTCSSCHHDLSHKQYLTRDYHQKTGQPRPNLSALEMVAATLQAVDRTAAERFLEKIQELNSVVIPVESIAQLDSELTAFRALRAAHPAENKAKEVLTGLLEYSVTNSSLYYETAEQLAMGIASAHAQLTDGGRRPAELDKIFKVLQSYDNFNPEQFSASCSDYLKSLSR